MLLMIELTTQAVPEAEDHAPLNWQYYLADIGPYLVLGAILICCMISVACLRIVTVRLRHTNDNMIDI